MNCTNCETRPGDNQGNLIEYCTCGCGRPEYAVIRHNAVVACIEQGVSPEDCVATLNSPPKGALSALRAAAMNMLRGGHLDSVPAEWTT